MWRKTLVGELSAEFAGTMIIILFGAGVVAQVVTTASTKAPAGAHDSIAWAWGIGVTLGIYVAARLSGAHLNPAVTVALATFKGFEWRKVAPYCLAQLAGAFVGGLVVRFTYSDLIASVDPQHTIATQGIFSTLPGNGAYQVSITNAFFDQVVGTAILVFVIFALTTASNNPPLANIGPLFVGLLVVGIGMAWGVNAGYAINPARDLGPRLASLAHRLLHRDGGPERQPLLLGAHRRSAARRADRWRHLQAVDRGLPARGGCRRGDPAGVRAPGGRQHRPHVLTHPTSHHHVNGQENLMPDFVGAVDQGTTSTRFMIFDHGGNEVARHQLEHEQILPQAGLGGARPGGDLGAHRASVIAYGARARPTCRPPTSPRSGSPTSARPPWCGTSKTGRPYYNAIVWQDTRTDQIASKLERDGHGDTIRHKAGIPPATYFSGGKIQWILDNVDGVREAAEKGDAIFGNTDAWLLWHLTGGNDGGVHVTDPTNASRTMLMDLETLEWDDELLAIFDIPRSMLPEIKPSSCPEGYGTTLSDGPLGGEVPLTGDPRRPAGGDRRPGLLRPRRGQEHLRHRQLHAAQHRHRDGPLQVRAAHHGRLQVRRRGHRLLPRGLDRRHRLGGAVAARPARHHQRRRRSRESLARQVDDNGGVYFVPAFSGLFAPYWRSDARGAIVGLSRFNTNAHVARATLEAICYQSRDVAEAMEKDSGVKLEVLKVDGGVTANELCMQIQADVLGVSVSRPVVAETTALGAAYAAGLAVGFWKNTDELRENWNEAKRWEPEWDDEQRETGYAQWQKAVSKTLDWVDVD